MKAYLGRLTAYDWLRVVSYATGALMLLEGPDVLEAWGMTVAQAQTWSTRIGTIVGALTLISNALKNPSAPSGTQPLYTEQAPHPVILPKSMLPPP